MSGLNGPGSRSPRLPSKHQHPVATWPDGHTDRLTLDRQFRGADRVCAATLLVDSGLLA
jgi:hypothetical protein